MISTTLPIVWRWLCDSTLHVSLMIAAILLLRSLLGGKLSPTWRCGLWAMVLLRLIVPVSSPWQWSAILNNEPQAFEQRTIVTVSGSETASPAPESAKATMREAAFSPTHRSVDGSTWLVLAWGTGATISLLIVARSQWRLHRWLRSLPTADAITQQRVADIADELRLRLPRVVLIRPGASPAVAGVLRPVLMLPSDFSERLSPAQLRLVMLHELHHIRRRDVLWRWLASLAVATQWFNPLAWLARRSFCIDCEYAADAATLRHVQTSRHLYGQTLLTMAATASPRRAIPGVIGVLGPSSVHRRIAAIVQPNHASRLAGVLAMLFAGCVSMQQRAATTAATADDTAHLVTQVYDVRDLLVPTTDDVEFVAGPATAPASDPTVGLSQSPGLPTAFITARQRLILAVQDGVDRPSWQIRGGRGTLDLSLPGGQLIVTQTPENQAAALRVLIAMRKDNGVQIMIETRFLQGAHVGSVARQLLGDHDDSRGTLSDSQVSQLIAAAQSNPNDTMLTAPRLTNFSGRRAYVVVSTARSYVADFITHGGDAGSAEPVVKTFEEGVRLDCQATASADRQYVTLTLHPQHTALRKLKIEPFKNKSSQLIGDLKIQVPVLEISSMETTVSLPDRRSFVAVIQPTLSPANDAMSPPDPVVILVKPTIADGSFEHPYSTATTSAAKSP